MTAETMAKTRKPSAGQEPAEDDVTTVKARKGVAKMISQLGSLLDINQQDVLDRYAKHIEDDLSAALAKRQAEIARRRAGTA